MKKTNGFTFVEVLISVSLLAFVILMSTTLFDRSIQETPKLRKIVEKNTKNSSEMENAILNARQYSEYYNDYVKKGTSDEEKKPQGYDSVGNPVVIPTPGLKIDDIRIDNVRGYIVSRKMDTVLDSATGKPILDSGGNYQYIQKTSYNMNVDSTDDLISFVGIGRSAPKVSDIKDFYLNNGTMNSFEYFPVNGSLASDKSFRLVYNLRNNSNFYSVRLRLLKSPFSQALLNNSNAINIKKLDKGEFEYADKADDENKSTNGAKDYTVNSYSSNKERYLSLTDRQLAVEGATLNINGLQGSKYATLSNENTSNLNFVYYIGLPYYNNDILAHYDADFAISKIASTRNKFLYLYDIDNVADSDYPNFIKKNGDIYDIDWSNYDIRRMTGIDTKFAEKVTLPKGFLPECTIKAQDGTDVKIPFNLKSYGNTIFYDMKKENGVEFDGGTDGRTFIAKFNTKNYNQMFNDKNEEKTFPYVLLSHGYDVASGKPLNASASDKEQNFVLYVDSDGSIKLKTGTAKKIKGGAIKWSYTEEDIGVNINDTNLYKDTSDTLPSQSYEEHYADGKKDGRQDFKIIAVYFDYYKSGSDSKVKLYLLNQSDSPDDTIITAANKIFERSFNKLNYTDYKFGFGKKIDNLGDAESISSPMGDDYCAMEISDLIYYNGDIGKNNVKKVMNWLYRKYLTEKERTYFDENYKSILDK